MKGPETSRPRLMPFGVVAVAVVFFFVAVATDIFWLGRLAFGAFPSTMPVPEPVERAFVGPDVLLSVLLYIAAYGLLKLRRYGFMAAYVGMGMWMFDTLLVLGITRLTYLAFLGPGLVFVIFAVVYLWTRKDLFC